MNRALAVVLCWSLPFVSTGCGKVEARGLAKEGNELYRAGKFEQALDKFEAAVRLDPEFPIIHLHMGYAAMSLAATGEEPASTLHAAKAIAAFGRYMRLAPGDERGAKFYLQALLDAGRTGDALGFLEKQHRANPRDVMIVSSLGVVSSRAGDFASALRWYEKRADLLPGEAKARYLIGTLCWEHLYKNSSIVGADRVRIADRGIAALQQAVKLQPGSPGESLTYINLLFRERAKGQDNPTARERDMEQARQYYRRALKALRGGKG